MPHPLCNVYPRQIVCIAFVLHERSGKKKCGRRLAHSNPFVLGSSSRIRSSREHAPRIALANALKIASIL
jgi:hypothetical protein